MKKLFKYITHIAYRLWNMPKFHKDLDNKLDPRFHSAAKLLYYPKLTAAEKRQAKTIEAFRAEVPKLLADKELYNYTSPKSNSFAKDESGHAVPGPYEKKEAKNILYAATSSIKGTLLKRLVEDSKSKRVLELGTQVGFSGCYMLSVDGLHLTTVEGSEVESEMANQNLARISKDFKVINELFDQAIEELIKKNEKFDCVYIDGQHEKEATIYYAERVKPLLTDQAVIIYDDIYFSNGMNEAWKELSQQKEVTQAMDLFWVGVCVYDRHNDGSRKELFDIGNYFPRPKIYYGDF